MVKQNIKKYELVAQYITDKIDKGDWKEGDVIPTVRELAKLYNVSPQTANKATSHLVSIGVLSSRQGSGSVVTKQSKMINNETIHMLIDSARASYIHGINTAMGYHAKEIYLSYLHAMEQTNESSKLIIYDKKATSIPDKSVFNNAKGLIIQGTPPECYMDYIRENNIPAVLINKNVQPSQKGRIGSVLMGYHGLEQLCTYIASLGHTKIIYGYSNEFEITEVYKNRLKAIEDYFKNIFQGSNFELYKFHFSKDSKEDGTKLRELHEAGFNAMICFNDISALRAYDLLHQLQIRIPEEMSVTGFDDLFMAEMAAPPLTTVRIDRTQLINDSLSLLNKLRSGDEPSYPIETTKTELILRRSCWKSIS